MQFSYTNNTIKIDNNDHYFTGQVNPNDFPEMIRADYEDIIVKSFDNYSDDLMTITNEFDEQQYKINFSFNKKPFNFNTVIIIFMEKYMKDFKDYMNERMYKLENEILNLKELVSKLTTNLIENEDNNSNSEKSDEDNNSSEEEVVPPPKKTPFTKSKPKTVRRT